MREFIADNAFDSIGEVDWMLRRAFVFRGEIDELIRTPEHMIETFWNNGYVEGDCDDISTLSASILRALGYPARFVAIRTDPTNPEYLHVFTEAKAFHGAQWERVDITVLPQVPMVYYGARLEQNV